VRRAQDTDRGQFDACTCGVEGPWCCPVAEDGALVGSRTYGLGDGVCLEEVDGMVRLFRTKLCMDRRPQRWYGQTPVVSSSPPRATRHSVAPWHVKGEQMHRRSIPSTTRWFALGFSVLLMLCGAPAQGTGQRDHAAANAEDAARVQITAVHEELNTAAGTALQDLCDQEFRFEHLINVGNGVQIHVIERFSGRSILRSPRRALLMLPATLAANNYFDAEVEGDPSFNALHQAASRGFFGFAMSYEGFGESTLPEDGRSVTAERLLDHTGAVVEWIRTHRFVPKVDVFGTSIGAGIAIAIGGTESPIDYRHINRVAIATNVYKHFSPETQAVFTPEFKAFLLDLPGGYITTTTATYVPIFAGMDPAALAWANANIPGTYSVGPVLEGFDLPFFEAAPGRAPLIQFWGSGSPTTPLSDVEQLQSEYGGPHQLMVYEGAAHNPILEPVRQQFWDNVEDFLNEGSHHERSLCK
jgi:pimeloyl-ACP methyl ester carboxylesterase